MKRVMTKNGNYTVISPCWKGKIWYYLAILGLIAMGWIAGGGK
jgi:hypothetical protein